MELILVRHGQPAWVSRAGSAVNDPGLTELGHRQAVIVADRLARTLGDTRRTRLLVSTARRSQETAVPIATSLGLRPEPHPWLHEIRFPDAWDGTPAEQVGAALRESRARPREQWWEGTGEHGGETFRDFHQRVTRGLEGLLSTLGVRRHPSDPSALWDIPEDAPRLVVVAHAGTNSVVLGHLLGLTPQPWEWERFASNHASVTVLDTTLISTGNIWSLQLFSGVAHLEEDLISS